jgi:hypothetical protein
MDLVLLLRSDKITQYLHLDNYVALMTLKWQELLDQEQSEQFMEKIK